ncbi:MAG: NAD(+)/NADH kinase [Bacteroidota bacterium]|nr:NAD(+)/NADH kinase [Bacteroidota bacterium]
MKLGIIVNLSKENILDHATQIIKKFEENGLDFLITDTAAISLAGKKIAVKRINICESDKIYKRSDLLISLGGDGTMLATSFKAAFYNKPVLGINLGKLGFLAEIGMDQIDLLINEIKNGSLKYEERMLLTGKCVGHNIEKLSALNDLVFDKGGWPKMIDLSVYVDEEFVTTYSADGLIVATPTGTTGYSLSTGGPIVSPKTDVITLSPICPHSLNIRPLVLPGDARIKIKANSLHKEIQINCDGQRVFSFKPPLTIEIVKADKPAIIAMTSTSDYFNTLRTKLMWGIDLRKNNQRHKE